MFDGDKKRTAGYCLEQFEKFFQGLREWDSDKLSYAEIHAAALFLREDENFEQLLRHYWSQDRLRAMKPESQSHQDWAVETAPDLIDGFFLALVDYMEAFKGNPHKSA